MKNKDCKGCKYAEGIFAQGGFHFIGCMFPPYKGKWIAEIEKCPKLEYEQALDWRATEAVLISINPEWCELIAAGKKTVEVRTTMPKLETPFKCYIYCTKEKNYTDILWCSGVIGRRSDKANGKVIGEFVCDKIEMLKRNTVFNAHALYSQSCLTRNEYFNYIGDKTAYIWHISDLVIYDKPKELGEFNAICPNRNPDGTRGSGNCPCGKYTHDFDEITGKVYCTRRITRPPQSWRYVEEAKNEPNN